MKKLNSGSLNAITGQLNLQSIHYRFKWLTMRQKKSIAGFIFTLPALIGIIWLFLIPMIQSFYMSLCQVELSQEMGVIFTFMGFKNFYDALFVDPKYNQVLFISVKEMIINVPIIVLFSFFGATLVNQKFKGQKIARVIFFLPIVISSTAMLTLDTWDFLQTTMRSSDYKAIDSAGSFLQSFRLGEFLMISGLPKNMVIYLSTSVDRIYQIISLSGVQIIVILASLQSISPSIYEASYVEGASSWEKFWLITFPIVSPILLLCIVYTIIDSFTAFNNWALMRIKEIMFGNLNFGLGSAMSWLYFVLIAAVLGIVVFFGSKIVFYYDK